MEGQSDSKDVSSSNDITASKDECKDVVDSCDETETTNTDVAIDAPEIKHPLENGLQIIY